MVSPASPLAPASTEWTLNWLAEQGYRVKTYPHTFAADDYLAGTDEQRAADLSAAFFDDETRAVLCSRGGYGCARLFPYLDIPELAATRKLFLGFSDITTLHLALNQAGLPTLHAPMALTLSRPREPWVYESLLGHLQGRAETPSEAPRGTTVVGGTARGIVTGGCLCLLTDSIGTTYPLETEGKILIIEDVDENPHRVDAMLTHLLNAGLAQAAAGIVIGEMTRSDDRVDEGIGGKPWRTIVADRLGGLGIPLITDFPFGHNANMLSLPLGIEAVLDADAGTLIYTEPLCEA